MRNASDVLTVERRGKWYYATCRACWLECSERSSSPTISVRRLPCRSEMRDWVAKEGSKWTKEEVETALAEVKREVR